MISRHKKIKIFMDIKTEDNNESYQVYMIYSKWSLSQLDIFLKEYVNKVEYLRKIFNLGKETNRTIVLLNKEVYNKLCQDGYGKRESKGFNISQFVLKDNNLPGEGKSKNLFIPVPKLPELTRNEIKTIINKKLESLVSWNIIKPNSWKLNVLGRSKNNMKSSCFINFTSETPVESISLVKILLTDTHWNVKSEEKIFFKCFWARERKQLTEEPMDQIQFLLLVEKFVLHVFENYQTSINCLESFNNKLKESIRTHQL